MFAIVDIEATHSKFPEGRMIEIAVILHNGYEVVGRFHSFVNPGHSIPGFIVNLTKITDEMVANAPKFYQIAPALFKILDGKIFVAHNVSFDYQFLIKEFQAVGMDLKLETLDTIDLSKNYLPGHPAYGLNKLTKSLGIKMKNHHRAIADVVATEIIFNLILEQAGQSFIEEQNNRLLHG